MIHRIKSMLLLLAAATCTYDGSSQIIVAQRTAGTAPLGVHFTVNESSWEALRDNDYQWVFPGGDTVIGFQALHTFDASGNVTLTITRPDFSTVTETLPVLVNDPGTVYPGSATTCISASGNFSGCPAGATTITTVDLSGILFAAGRRFMFREGEVFTLSGSKTLSAGCFISSYGNGKATIRIAGDPTGTAFWLQDSITITGIRFEGTEWIKAPDWSDSAYGEGRLFAPGNHNTLYDLEVRNMTTFAVMDDGIGAKNNLVIDRVSAENLGSYFLYAGPSPSIGHSGVRNSSVFNVMANHGIRLNGGRYFIASQLHIDSVERSHITYRGLSYGIVSDSRFTGKGFYKNSIRNIYDDASVTDTVRYIIFERNRYASRPNEFALDFNIGTDIVVRNNLLLNSSLNVGFNLSGIIPQRVEIVHNTFYRDSYGWYPQLTLRPGGSGSFRGNIIYAENCTGGCIDDHPFSSGSSENAVEWSIDQNAYFVSGDPSGGNFKNGMGFSGWQSMGMDTAGSYGDMTFVSETAQLSIADFMPTGGGMLGLAAFLTHRDLQGRRRNPSGNDAGALESNPFTGIGKQPIPEYRLVLFPNPAVDWVHLKSDLPENTRMSIFDAQGRMVQSSAAIAGTICTAHLPAGLYIVKLEGENGIRVTGRFIRH